MFRRPACALAAAALAVLSACDGEVNVPLTAPGLPVDAAVSGGVFAAGGAITMYPREEIQLRASDKISRARVVRWTSSNAAVAKVSSLGSVIGMYRGDATITASGGGSSERTAFRVLDAASVVVAASRSNLLVGERISLSASVVASDGSTSIPTRITWSVASGTAVNVSTAGQVTGVSTGPATVSATIGGGVTGAVVFSVAGIASDPSAPIATAFSIAPKPAVVQVGTTLQFTPAVTWSDGASRAIAVVYTATGGTIDLNGLFRAGQVAGTFAVFATCSCGRVDTSSVSVLSSSAPAVLSALRISPKPISLLTGSTQQFAVQSDWSDGIARAVSVSFSATAGTISASGLYSAPASPGTFFVVASQVGGPRADTSVVTVYSQATGGGPSFVPPASPATYNPSYPTLTGVTRRVNDGGDLQSALNAAQPGDEVVLASNAVFTGNFVLPAKNSGSAWIVVRAESVPTPAGVRTSPSVSASSATIVSPNSAPAIQTANGASRWRLVGLNVTQSSGLSINYGLVVLGMGDEATRAAQPSNIVLDRMYVHGTTTDNLKRCVAFNGDSLAVVDSWLSECHGKGFDSQGIAGWNGAGPFLIQNNHIEAAGQAVMFGGADPVIQNLSPSDIVIRRNHMFKPLSWGNGVWTIKATFELKHARRVLFEGNVLENHWADAQVGYAILIQTLSDQNTAWAWTTIQDVTIQNNIIKNSTSGINMHARVAYGGGPLPTNPTSRVLIANNLFTEVGRDPISGGTGKLLQLLSDLRDVTIISNTMVFSGEASTAVSLDGGGQVGLTLVNNVFPQTAYGIIGNIVGVGTPAITAYAPGAVVRENIFPGQPGSVYPSGNYFPSSATSIAFASSSSGNYELSPRYSFFQGSFGKIGLDYATLASAVAGAVQ